MRGKVGEAILVYHAHRFWASNEKWNESNHVNLWENRPIFMVGDLCCLRIGQIAFQILINGILPYNINSVSIVKWGVIK